MYIYVHFDILSFVRISRLNWSGHFNRMDSKKKEVKFLKNNRQGSRLRGQPKNRWWNCVQADTNECRITKLKER